MLLYSHVMGSRDPHYRYLGPPLTPFTRPIHLNYTTNPTQPTALARPHTAKLSLHMAEYIGCCRPCWPQLKCKFASSTDGRPLLATPGRGSQAGASPGHSSSHASGLAELACRLSRATSTVHLG